MSTKKKKKPASKKAKGETVVQGYFEGVEPYRDKKLDVLCQRVIDATAEHSQAKNEEHDARTILIEKLNEAKIPAYEYNGQIFEAPAKQRLRFRKKKEPKPAKVTDKNGINPGPKGSDVVDLDEPEENEEKKEFVDAVSGETSTEPK